MTTDPPEHFPIPEDPGRALVVDDEPVILDLYGEVLTKLGFQVDKALDGVAGLDQIRLNPYAVVIADVRMPKMSGCELLLHAEQVRPGIEDRFIFTTSGVEDLTTHEYMLVTEKPCIYKPATLEAIEKAICDLFRR